MSQTDILSRLQNWLRSFFQQILGEADDSYYVSDLLAPGGSQSYKTVLKKAGRITSVWFQFYWTTCLLQISVNVDGSNIFKTTNNSDSFIALHNVAESFAANFPFLQNATLEIAAYNADTADPHRVRVQVAIKYNSS